MPDSLLYITLTNSDDVYTPGSVVEGIAHLVLHEPMKARKLKIIFEGLACTACLSTITASNSFTLWVWDTGVTSVTYIDPYFGKAIYANDEIIAWTASPGEKEVLAVGTYQFQFAFKLPAELPPSFEGIFGYIRYMVKMEIDRPWRFNKKDKKVFTVVPTFNLNSLSRTVMPVKETKGKNLGFILFRHGKCETNKSGFVPGEMVLVSIRVINDSSKDIVKAEIKLIEVSNCVASWGGGNFPQSSFIAPAAGDARTQRRKLATKMAAFNDRRTQRRKLATGEQDADIAQKSKGVIQLYLQVPSTVPSFDNCPIIKVEYFIEVKLTITGSINSKIEVEIPIVIGTVPVRGTYEDGVPSTSASAPPEKEEAMPPPYLDGDTVPPSYVESVKGVEGTVVDMENMEPFVPRYPFYPNLRRSDDGDLPDKDVHF
ncbi:unnamed protein product [Cylicocyclus nassatus]|uniref:Arrestin C-terminal-like domain-containing protein n=1 Tax=Cylicocyclus nassatus TaxID=53992 RepID=A0AA36GSE3_CYLNA|nr:unnamed protein product [Cylicocyclus nassatus]